jgi:hypothetical protein
MSKSSNKNIPLVSYRYQRKPGDILLNAFLNIYDEFTPALVLALPLFNFCIIVRTSRLTQTSDCHIQNELKHEWPPKLGELLGTSNFYTESSSSTFVLVLRFILSFNPIAYQAAIVPAYASTCIGNYTRRICLNFSKYLNTTSRTHHSRSLNFNLSPYRHDFIQPKPTANSTSTPGDGQLGRNV